MYSQFARLVLAVFSLSLICASGLIAQTLPGDARTLVRNFATHGNLTAPTWAMCPSKSSQSDSLFVGLLALEQTDDRVGLLATHWSSATGRCKDPRLDQWFRARLAEQRPHHVVFAVLSGLLSNPTTANVEVLERFAADTTRDLEHREYVLNLFSRRLSVAQRQSLFFKMLENTPRLPSNYRRAEFDKLGRSSTASSFVVTLIDFLRRFPNKPDARWIVDSVTEEAAKHTGVGTPPPWVGQFRSALDELERRGDVPEDLKDAIKESKWRLAVGK
jgi:hypothetical protein